MEHDPGQELVKCVLVGDTAVGKTRLICGRACNARASLRQLFTTHVPTVFAIDQYRMYKEVLERSMSFVDGVSVSLRLWDTFGDHEKDRRFAYGRSDIVLLCFSIGSRISLQHCKTQWFPEIRRFCPDTPVILVGCKNDLRFLINDPAYAECCRERSPFSRQIREADLVMADQARVFARELGIPYYETSVYTYYGVDQVFENAIRAALLARKNQRFWMTNLKHVRQPLLQAPYCPPKKDVSCLQISSGDFWHAIEEMLREQEFPDLIFQIRQPTLRSVDIFGNQFILGVGARKLIEFCHLELLDSSNRRNSITSESTTSGEEECLLGNTHIPSTSTMDTCNTLSTSAYETIREVIESIEYGWNSDGNVGTGNTSGPLVIRFHPGTFSVEALKAYLNYLYIGELPKETSRLLYEDLKRIADAFDSREFGTYLRFWGECDKTMMTKCQNIHHTILSKALWKQCQENFCSDVAFELDDGVVEAHRAILAHRSDVMRAMFSGDFRERRSHFVQLPGVRSDVFRIFLEYIYTDRVETVLSIESAIAVIELANRLCLCRLINIIENLLISILRKNENLAEVLENCLRNVEPAQLHNAERLAEFCMVYIASNYDDISRNHGKLFKELDPENRQWVLQNRWPPVWYVKDLDYYHKALRERYKMETLDRKKMRKRNSSGCLCFTNGRKPRCKSTSTLPDPQNLMELTN